MLKHGIIFLFLATIAATAAYAQRSIGYTITCLKENAYCEKTIIYEPEGNIRWYPGVFVEGDGNLARVQVSNRSQCTDLCIGHPRCILVEYYYGDESPSPACNLYSSMRQLKRNSSGDAHVGIYE